MHVSACWPDRNQLRPEVIDQLVNQVYVSSVPYKAPRQEDLTRNRYMCEIPIDANDAAHFDRPLHDPAGSDRVREAAAQLTRTSTEPRSTNGSSSLALLAQMNPPASARNIPSEPAYAEHLQAYLQTQTARAGSPEGLW
jgi:hypothetical protein